MKTFNNNQETTENQELVTVMTTIDRGVVSIARSILEAESIPFYVNGEVNFGLVTLTTLNPMEIRVPEAFEETARGLLKELASDK